MFSYPQILCFRRMSILGSEDKLHPIPKVCLYACYGSLRRPFCNNYFSTLVFGFIWRQRSYNIFIINKNIQREQNETFVSTLEDNIFFLRTVISINIYILALHRLLFQLMTLLRRFLIHICNLCDVDEFKPNIFLTLTIFFY